MAILWAHPKVLTRKLQLLETLRKQWETQQTWTPRGGARQASRGIKPWGAHPRMTRPWLSKNIRQRDSRPKAKWGRPSKTELSVATTRPKVDLGKGGKAQKRAHKFRLLAKEPMPHSHRPILSRKSETQKPMMSKWFRSWDSTTDSSTWMFKLTRIIISWSPRRDCGRSRTLIRRWRPQVAPSDTLSSTVSTLLITKLSPVTTLSYLTKTTGPNPWNSRQWKREIDPSPRMSTEWSKASRRPYLLKSRDSSLTKETEWCVQNFVTSLAPQPLEMGKRNSEPPAGATHSELQEHLSKEYPGFLALLRNKECSPSSLASSETAKALARPCWPPLTRSKTSCSESNRTRNSTESLVNRTTSFKNRAKAQTAHQPMTRKRLLTIWTPTPKSASRVPLSARESSGLRGNLCLLPNISDKVRDISCLLN